MSVRMTIRVDDESAAFVDRAAGAGEGSRAEVVNRALRHERRRRAAARDAQVYAASEDPELESDSYADWSAHTAAQAWADFDDQV